MSAKKSKFSKGGKPKNKFATRIVPRSKGSRIAPAAIYNGTVTTQRPTPKLITTPKGVVIKHREFFKNPTSVAGFVVTSFDIQPGNSGLFPWLSAIALRYETYRFRKLAFIYDSQLPTTYVGSIGYGVDFDVSDPAPADLVEFLSMADSGTCPVWSPLRLEVDLSGAHTAFRYTRAGLPSGIWDQKTYDVGRLYHFTSNLAAGNQYGLLSVEYEVELCTPQIQDEVGGAVVGSTGLAFNRFWGTAPVAQGHTRLPYSIDTLGQIVTFLEPFDGIISGELLGTALVGAMNIAYTGSLVYKNILSNINGAQTSMTFCAAVSALAGATMQLLITSAATATGSRVVLSKAAYDQI